MKTLFLTSILMLLMSCHSTQNMQVKVKKNYFNKTMTTENDVKITEKWQVVPHATVHFAKDKFGVGMAKLNKGSKTVFYYKYDMQPIDKTIMDGGYIQEVFFEIEGPLKNLSLKDKELSKINLLVGKHGFFRGSGVYAVQAGSFDLKILANDKIEINIDIVKPDQMVQKKKLHTIIELNQESDE